MIFLQQNLILYKMKKFLFVLNLICINQLAAQSDTLENYTMLRMGVNVQDLNSISVAIERTILYRKASLNFELGYIGFRQLSGEKYIRHDDSKYIEMGYHYSIGLKSFIKIGDNTKSDLTNHFRFFYLGDYSYANYTVDASSKYLNKNISGGIRNKSLGIKIGVDLISKKKYVLSLMAGVGAGFFISDNVSLHTYNEKYWNYSHYLNLQSGGIGVGYTYLFRVGKIFE